MNKAMEFGAAGFIPKSTPVETIFEAIIKVLAGHIWLPDNFERSNGTDNIEIADRVASLTGQQHKILMMHAEPPI